MKRAARDLDEPVGGFAGLILACGGSPADEPSRPSFTGMLLAVIEKADYANRARLRAAYPREVAAYEIWFSSDGQATVGQLRKLTDAIPEPERPGVTARAVLRLAWLIIRAGRARP